MKHEEAPQLYGLLAEFDSADDLTNATKAVYDAGYRKIDAYTPFPCEPVMEAMHVHHNWVPLIVLVMGIIGGSTGFAMQYWGSVIHYPWNIGNRPFYSWPAFIPVTFELTVLFAAFSGVIGMLLLNGLPQPYHPLFNVEKFERASQDGFFLAVEATDPKFDHAETKKFLESLHPKEVFDVEP